MSWHTPERKAEQAFEAWLKTVEDSVLSRCNIRTRFSNAVKTLPSIDIVCDTAKPDIVSAQVFTGNWICSIEFTVISHYERGVDAEAHDEYVGLLTDLLMQVDESSGDEAVSGYLNGVATDADITAYLWTPGERTNSVEEKTLVTKIRGELWMKPSK